MALTQISTGGIKDDAVTDAKLPANSVGNSEMKDDAVGVAELSATGTASSSTFLRGDNSWQAISTTPEGTSVLSTGETGTAKFLRVDGDNSCSWQVPPDTNTQVGGSTGVDFNDDIKSRWGTGNDIEIYHRSSDDSAIIKNVNDTGFLRILSGDTDSSGILLKNRDDGVTYLRAKNHDGIELFFNDSVKFETTSTGVSCPGILQMGTSSSYIDLPDNASLYCGTGDDLRIYHDSVDTYINNSTGTLYLRGDTISLNAMSTTDKFLDATNGGATNLYYDNSKKFETTSTGISITGKIACDDDSDIDMDSSSSGQLRIGGDGWTGAIALNDDGMQIYHNSSARSIIFGINETERVRIDSSGRMMIGVADTAHASGNADDLCVGNNDSTSEHGITIGSNVAGGIRWADSASGSAGVIEYVHSDNRMTFATNGGTERLRIHGGGDVEVKTGSLIIGTAGEGIDFAATSDAAGKTNERLEDYEEGTFTPTWNNVTNASTHAVWNYIKVGRLVHVSGWFKCNTTTNSGSDGVSATLPFTTAANPTNGYIGFVGNIMYENINSYSSGNFVTLLTDNTSTFYPYKCQQNGAWENLRSDDVSADDKMIISFCYRI